MPGNPFYRSPFWRALRQAVLDRDGGRCAVKGCGEAAVVVDHVQARPRGATGPTALDVMGNCRSLCRSHDNQAKEDGQGRRRSGGHLTVTGCDANGYPLDPHHPWNRKS